MKKICDTCGIPADIFEFPEDSTVDVAKVSSGNMNMFVN
jgi:hypothetical protein